MVKRDGHIEYDYMSDPDAPLRLTYPDPITPSFFTGDVVTLKSGGPKMTVLWQRTTPQALMECRRKGWPDGAVSVEWLDSVGHRHAHKYHPLQLIKV